jgi:L-aspartate oxidase
MDTIATDVLVIGSGLAGCAAALAAARRGVEVTVITKQADPKDSNTYHAQGGIIFRGRTDSPEKLAADIHEAGAGLCRPAAVELLAREGPRLVEEILINDIGVPFDRAPGASGEFDLTAEAAHSEARIIHSADSTGKSIEHYVLAALQREPHVTLLTRRTAIDLLTLSHHSRNLRDVYAPPTCVGAYVFNQETGRVETIMAKETILAPGGLGRAPQLSPLSQAARKEHGASHYPDTGHR